MKSHLREHKHVFSSVPSLSSYKHINSFPLALSGQCIVDCQQCTVGSGLVVSRRRLHVSVAPDLVWCLGSFHETDTFSYPTYLLLSKK